MHIFIRNTSPMTALMEKVLTDTQVRDTAAMQAYALSNDSVATPWRD